MRQKADAESLLADTAQAYDDTEAQKEADIEFPRPPCSQIAL